MTVRRRLEALERRISSNDAMTVVHITGGLPEPFMKTAAAGTRTWQQLAGESSDVFRERVLELATAYGAKHLVLGGLPDEC